MIFLMFYDFLFCSDLFLEAAENIKCHINKIQERKDGGDVLDSVEFGECEWGLNIL